MMYNYDALKRKAKEQGVRVSDLLALAPQNDPFYTGRPSEIQAAQWFADLWARFGYTTGVHLRRIHYQIVSQDPPVQMPNGSGIYENTQNHWDYLNNAAKWARYLDLVPVEAFVDRRNPESVINARFPKPGDWMYDDPTPGWHIGYADDEWESLTSPTLPELPDLPRSLPHPPSYYVEGYDGIQQEYLVEVWVEKTTMNDVLEPLCRLYGVNLVTGAGELSITVVIKFLERAREADRLARILYVSDFDPAGLGMPISIARKVEFYQRKLDDLVDIDIRLEPVALTHDQVAQYKLPRVPVKDSDLRKASFEAAYGTGQVELDALEALHPGELKRIVMETILQYYDPYLERRAQRVRRNAQYALSSDEANTYEPYTWRFDVLNAAYQETLGRFQETRARFAEMARKFRDELDAYNEELHDIRRLGKRVYGKLYTELEANGRDIEDEFPLPEADLLPEDDELLYDSRRSYLEQLRYYTAHRHNAEQLTLEEV
ncbi:MAG: hypothetical protein JXA33_10860 [Anaerolineae bacterium]|nr:hypothetical protein [Anaerolineae bacterium]